MDLKTEEDVKVKFLLPQLKELGYRESHCEFEKAIEVHEGRKVKKIFADVIVYTSSKRDVPLILCETKAPTEVLNRRVKEQAISYARLLPRIAPLTLITNGLQVQVFHTLNKARLEELPRRSRMKKDLLDFFVPKAIQEALRTEAKYKLFIIDDVQTFKSILKSCHNEIRNNEGYDPTVAFDEMSKVLFCKLYEEKHSGDNRFRLSVFDDSIKRLRVNVVKQIFEETKRNERYSELFPLDTVINLQDRTIRKIVSLFEDYDLSLTAFDVKGEAYEYFLGDTFTGGLGEYFTPRNIVEFIVEAIDPKIGENIVDPFCGTGGFLIYAFEIVSEKISLQEFAEKEKERWRYELSNRCLFGTDWKERTSQACKMNMMVHGDGSAGIFMHHGLINVRGKIEEDRFDICITNPPFGSFENDPEILANYDLGAGRKSQARGILALERALRLVKPEGWVGIVAIDGILNNASTRYVRDYIKRHAWIRAVVGMTKETFEGYGSQAKTSVLLLEKKVLPDEGQQQPVFMAIAKNTGYAPNGGQVPGNELPDILLAYKAYRRGERGFPLHHNCSVAELQDRLDAEYYSSGIRTDNSVNVRDVEKNYGEILQDVTDEYHIIVKDLDETFHNLEYQEFSLRDLLDEVSAKETIKPDKSYRLLGVRSWGGGAFIREEKPGREIKGKTLYGVKPGWIVYNRLFAYRGSFAVIGDEHEGCYTSVEFPKFSVKEGFEKPDILSRYIVHCLNSPQYLEIVDAQSTGSTKTRAC